MAEVTIKLKCHWEESADKEELYLSQVKPHADYMRGRSAVLHLQQVLF